MKKPQRQRGCRAEGPLSSDAQAEQSCNVAQEFVASQALPRLALALPCGPRLGCSDLPCTPRGSSRVPWLQTLLLQVIDLAPANAGPVISHKALCVPCSSAADVVQLDSVHQGLASFTKDTHSGDSKLKGTACPPELAFQHHLQGCSSNVIVADKDPAEQQRRQTGLSSPEPPGHWVVETIADIHPGDHVIILQKHSSCDAAASLCIRPPAVSRLQQTVAGACQSTEAQPGSLARGASAA